MFKLLRLKWKKELEETKSIYAIELRQKEAENELKLKEVTTLLRLESQQKLSQLSLEHDREIEKIRNESANELLKLKENLLSDAHKRLSDAMTKLHEEGNLQTKFTQELAFKMFEKAPTTKSQINVITKGEDG